jgi:hypothetical protein
MSQCTQVIIQNLQNAGMHENLKSLPPTGARRRMMELPTSASVPVHTSLSGVLS